jgi:TM2 domain-containing membrane protein YozV
MAELAIDVAVAQKKAQQRVLIGAGLVVLGCMFGGILAIVLYLLGLIIPAIIVIIMGVITVVIGVIMQVIAFRVMQAIKRGGS